VTLLIDLLAPHLQPYYLQSDHPLEGNKQRNKEKWEKKTKTKTTTTTTTTTTNHNLNGCLCGSSLGNDLSRLCFHATFGANSPQICFKYFVNSPLDRIQTLVGFSNNSLGFYLFKQLGLQ
jgi:hypothetical protein